METRKMTLEDLKECIQTVQDGGEVELFLPEGKESDVFRRVDLRDYMETLFCGVVPVIYEKYTPRVMTVEENVKGEPEQVKKEIVRKTLGKKREPEQPKEIDRGKILALAKAGWSDLKIAKEMNLPTEEIRKQLEEH